MICPKHFVGRFYSTKVSAEALRKWRVGNIQRPRSLLDDDDGDHTPVDLSEDDDAVNGVRPNSRPLHRRKPPKESTPHEFAAHRELMQKKFPDGWNPPRKISREAMDGLRQLHQLDSQTFSTPVLADKFKISPEAVRRILKSRWQPSKEKQRMGAERDRKNYSEFITLNRVKERIELERIKEIQKATRSAPKGKAQSGDGFFFD